MKNTPKPPGLEETGKILKEQADSLERSAFFKPPKNPTVVKETRMPEGLFFLFGIFFFIAATVVLLKVRDNDAKKAVDTYQTLLGAVNSLSDRLDSYIKSQGTVCDSFKEDIAKLKDKTSTPQTLNVEFPKSMPVSVTLIERQVHHEGPHLPPTPDKQPQKKPVPSHVPHKAPSLDQ